MQPPPVHRSDSKPDAKALQAAAADAGLVLPDAALQAFREGRMIEAIKLIRVANPGLDLARAKAAMQRLQASQQFVTGVESSQRQDGLQPPQARPQPQARGTRPPTVEMGDRPGQLRWLLLVVALLAAAAWIALGGMPG
ncbi:MAG TPA: hypothetical protein VN205_02030 [Thermomonas sp.]|nr:hypothetical protein [Thermomonas sp.]